MKKHAPEQYKAKTKTVAVKPATPHSEHPAASVANQLVNWMERGGVPPSIILLHGLCYARSKQTDGLPVDTLRPQLQMQGTDSKVISQIMDALAHPQAVKTRVIREWLQSIWVKKSSLPAAVISANTERKIPAHINKSVNKPVNKPKSAKPAPKPKDSSAKKPVVVVKQKRSVPK